MNYIDNRWFKKCAYDRGIETNRYVEVKYTEKPCIEKLLTIFSYEKTLNL